MDRNETFAEILGRLKKSAHGTSELVELTESTHLITDSYSIEQIENQSSGVLMERNFRKTIYKIFINCNMDIIL
jgi:hypothetical protein